MNSKQIKQRLNEHYDEVLGMGYEVMCIVLQGSQNYKLDLYENGYCSDVDSRAVILPTFDDFCINKAPISTTYVRHNKEHIDIKDIRPFFNMLKKQNPNALEVLYSPYYIVSDKYKPYWNKLKKLRDKITHCHPALTLTTLTGTINEKRKILCHSTPNNRERVESSGYDGKQLYTIIRIREFMQNYIDGLSFEKCLTCHSEENYRLIVDAKLNKLPYAEAIEIANRLCAEAEEIKSNFIQTNGSECDASPYSELELILKNILKKYLKEQID